MQVWVADGEAGLIRVSGGERCILGPPCASLCSGWGRVYCAGKDRCVCFHCISGERLFDAAIPGGVCGLAMMGERVCALSSDADSVTAFSAHTGELLCCAPAGIYPRGLCASRTGRLLAVAGGASGSVLLLDGDLRLVREYQLPGIVCGVCFLQRGLCALCAVEQGDITSRLMRLSYRGVAEEILALPMPPSCLCGFPNGACAAGCMGETVFLSPHKKIAFRRSYPCPLAIRAGVFGPLICDGIRGDVSLPDGRILYQGKLPQDALLIP